MNPERPPAPDEIEEGQIEETHFKQARTVWDPFDPRRIVVGVLAIALILMSLLWIGHAVGLLVAFYPGGLLELETWVWGTVGLLGLLLLVVAVVGFRRPEQWKD